MNNIFKIMRKIYRATKRSYNNIKLFYKAILGSAQI